MTETTLTAVQYGVGPIGSRIVRAARERGVEYVGAIDVDPEKVGADLGDVAGLDESLGVKVVEDPDEALSADPDIVFHSTVSSVERAAPQLKTAMAAGADIVSTTEELTYPYWSNPDVATELQAAATENDVTCLGTGINPGFVMDTFPAVCSTPMADVESVHVERIQNAGMRRGPLQEKVGAGVDVETFEEEIASGAGHVGSTESVAMLADALGWELDEIDETIEPIIADERVVTDHVTVERGDVAGVRQVARGVVDGGGIVALDLQMYVGADEPRDVIDFEGDPDVSITVDGGFHGDVSTSAVVINVAPRVHEEDSGLATMIDLALPSFVRG